MALLGSARRRLRITPRNWLNPSRACLASAVLFVMTVAASAFEGTLVLGDFAIQRGMPGDRGLFEDLIFLSLFVYPIILLICRKYLIHPLFWEFTKHKRFSRATHREDRSRVREIIKKSKDRFLALKCIRLSAILNDRLMAIIFVILLCLALAYFAGSKYSHANPMKVYHFNIWCSLDFKLSYTMRAIVDFIVYVLILPYFFLEIVILIVEFCKFYSRISQIKFIDFMYISHYEKQNIELPGRVFSNILITFSVMSIPITVYYLTYPDTFLLQIGTIVFTIIIFIVAALPVFFIFNLLHRARHTTAIRILNQHGLKYLQTGSEPGEEIKYSHLLVDITHLNSLKVHPISRGILILLLAISAIFAAISNGIVTKGIEHLIDIL
ncbi:MAG: hypothetical protein GC206_07170 [Alphaproteobacteria bacterium]|nr:hypothetical protein [Alphaproteobacteria bacterium]